MTYIEAIDKAIEMFENFADQDWYTEEQQKKSEECRQIAKLLRNHKALEESYIYVLDENDKLKRKYRKARKEKKRWKRKYLGLKAEIEQLDFSAPKKVTGEEEIKITW